MGVAGQAHNRENPDSVAPQEEENSEREPLQQRPADVSIDLRELTRVRREVVQSLVYKLDEGMPEAL
jgi:hypothetical protein